MAQHNNFGNSGEEAAADFLRKKGYHILSRNWKSGKLELDIVAEYNNMLVFVEVKSRSTKNFEHPLDAIDDRKIRNLVNAASIYIQQYNINLDARFDVISVIPTVDGYEIEHIEDAFLPPLC